MKVDIVETFVHDVEHDLPVILKGCFLHGPHEKVLEMIRIQLIETNKPKR